MDQLVETSNDGGHQAKEGGLQCSAVPEDSETAGKDRVARKNLVSVVADAKS